MRSWQLSTNTFHMDQHQFGRILLLQEFTFSPSRYAEYEGGKLKSRGLTNLKVRVRSTHNGYNRQTSPISVNLVGNDIPGLIESSFEFDVCMGSEDRLLLYILPEESNVEHMTHVLLKTYGFPFTRYKKDYTSLEPVVGSIYTDNMVPVKLSFTLCNPERLIELF